MAGELTDAAPVWCSGCGHRWDSPLRGAELCGDCWRIAQPALHAVKTYRDGVGIERCTVCSSALRTLADDPLVSLRLVDVEDMLLLLTDVLRKQSADLKASIVAADAWTSLIDRLEKVCGRTAGQLHIAKGDRLL